MINVHDSQCTLNFKGYKKVLFLRKPLYFIQSQELHNKASVGST